MKNAGGEIPEILRQTNPIPAKIAIFQSIFAHSSSAVTVSEKV